MYGTTVMTYRDEERSIIGGVETTPAGNVALRIGRKADQGWCQTEHVVLTPAEAHRLGSELIARADNAEGGENIA
jgi:hypothetical protein